MKIKMTATELSETNVDRVALVKRGANRTPFRITKSEGEEMFDLHSLLKKSFVRQEASTGILAIGFTKSEGSDALAELLLNAKLFEGETVREANDQTATITRKGLSLEGSAVIKCDGEVLLIVPDGEAVKKEFSSYNFDSTIFGEVMKQGSYYPSVMVAQDLLGNTIMNIMDGSSNPKEATDAITKACKEFTDYVSILTKSLPAKAFKADAVIRKATSQKMSVQEASNASDTNNETQTGDAFASASLANNGQSAANMIPPGYEVGVDGTGAPFLFRKKDEDMSAEELAAVQKAEKEAEAKKVPAKKGEEGEADTNKSLMLEVRSALSGLGDRLTKSFDEKLSGIRKDVTTIGDKVSKTEKALQGTIVGGDGEENTGLRKGEEEDEHRSIPVIDTAYTPVKRAGRPGPQAH